MNIALKREEDVMRILVTGGAGFIGSHTCVELIRSGFEVVVVDNLCNSSRASINRIEKMLNCKIPFYRIDVRNKNELIKIFDAYKFNGVIHFAGLKAVGDSVKNPAEYYDNNVLGTFALLDVMDKASCKSSFLVLLLLFMETLRLFQLKKRLSLIQLTRMVEQSLLSKTIYGIFSLLIILGKL